MKLVIAHGATSVEHMLKLLGEGGLRRPFRLCTMDYLWYEVGREVKVTSYLFKDKLAMMQFVLAHQGDDRPVALVARDQTDESAAMAASFHAMNAVDFTFNPSGDT